MHFRVRIMPSLALAGAVLLGPWAQSRADPDVSQATVRSRIDSGRYAEAESLGWMLLRASEPKPAADSLDYARAIDLLVEALVENGHQYHPRTLPLADLAVGICERRAAGPADRARALRARSWLCEENQNAEEIRFLERASNVLAAGSADSVLLARVLDDLGQAYMDHPRDAAADSVFQAAAAIRDRLLPAGHPDIAWGLMMQSLPVWSRGHGQEAVALLEHSAAMMERCLGPDHPRLARVLSVLALRQRFLGDYEASERNYARAIGIDERALRPDHPRLARHLMFAAGNLEAMGEIDEAVGLSERALAIRQRELPPDHPDLAWSMAALGENLVARGDVGPGRVWLERALAIQQRVLSPGDLQIGITLRVLIGATQCQGDTRRMLEMATESQAIYERYFGEDNPDLFWARFHVAEAEVDNGQFQKAADLLRAELPHAEAAEGRQGLLSATALWELGYADAGLGRWTEARRDWARDLEIGHHAFPPGHVDLAATTDLSRAEEMLGHDDRALALLQGLGAYPDSGGSRWNLARARLLLADALWRKGERDAALRQALVCGGLARGLVLENLEYLPEEQGFGVVDVSTLALGLALRFAAATPGLVPDLERATYDAVIRSRAIVLDAASRRAARARQAGGPASAAVESSLAVVGQRVANLEVKVASNPSPLGFKILADTQRERQSLEIEAEGLAPHTDTSGRAGFIEVAAALPESSALVSFASYEHARIAEELPSWFGTAPVRSRSARRGSYLAFVLRSGAPAPDLVPLGDAARIDSLVESYDVLMARPPAAGAASAEVSSRTLGNELRAAIWDPVRSRLGPAKRAFIVLDGALLTVNIAALPEGERGYVVERGPTLHYLNAERDLVAPSAPLPGGRGLLAVGDPDFDVAPGPASAPLAAGGAPPLRSNRVDCPEFRDVRFPSLPAARQEIEGIARIWTRAEAAVAGGAAGADPVDILSAGAASEASFKREAPGHRVLHLATHGFYYAGGCATEWPGVRGIGRLVPVGSARAASLEPAGDPGGSPLLLSGLALSGANRRHEVGLDQDDGILTAEEIAALDLSSVEWAVVSACESGAGAVRNGEGVMGLRRAFQEAGVRTSILSLWPVEDRSARRWMEALYEARFLRRLDTADAVRAASLTVLAERRQHGLSTNPFYWGGFVACGYWR